MEFIEYLDSIGNDCKKCALAGKCAYVNGNWGCYEELKRNGVIEKEKDYGSNSK